MERPVELLKRILACDVCRNIRPVIMGDEKFKELVPGDMDIYKNRLNTFMTKEWKGTISMKDMADAGFCYTGTSDEVVCFKCKGVISNWSKFKVPRKLHKKIYPRCDFVINLRENEIKRRNKIQFDGSQQNTDPGETSDEEDDMEFFLSEFNRLMSFEKWPLSSPVDRYNLAATGFYCVDGMSTVICVGCAKEVSDWKLGDRPKEKHQDVDGMSCPFATNKGSEEEGMDVVEIQQFIRHCLSSAVFMENDKFKVLFPADMASYKNRLDTGETSEDEDDMEFFWSEFNRLMSFEKWPLSSPVDRYDLVATGFYCVDGTSAVICVGCDKEVSDWKLGDRPKEKHQDVDGMSCPFATNKGSEEEGMDEVEIQQFIRHCISTKK